MRLVVDLNDEVYSNIVVKNEYTDRDVIAVHNALMGAIRIPEGHGRLIDADETIKTICGKSCGCEPEECGYDVPCYSVKRINSATTIIEADTTRDCKTCGHSNGGKCAGTEECHDCMWESKYIEADKGESE